MSDLQQIINLLNDDFIISEEAVIEWGLILIFDKNGNIIGYGLGE